MAESAVLRTVKNTQRSSEEAQQQQTAMSQLYLYEAVALCNEKSARGNCLHFQRRKSTKTPEPP